MSRIKPLRIIKPTNSSHTGSVIFLHGSGDTGKGILDWIKFLIRDFSLPHIKFIFPTAPLRPYTPLDGALSNVWFNRYDITPDVPEHVETLDDIKHDIKSLISEEVDAGIPLNRIVVGGFSMGGALALHTAYRFTPGLGGVFALSSFLNNESEVYKTIQAVDTPLFMCHGDRDELVPLEWGEETFNNLTKLGVKGEFIPLTNTLHELKKNELEKLLEWTKIVIPPERGP
ncbi:lysophospholipase-like protein 1 [Tribolium madens]|uniref:lysophospholipase-like protein 1 n=1 Tax=Tribolium madens TaxID=41895 RepID=UPI001CF73DA0|nr:lysophospholipase-like protein 1 [Tribolium madens]